MGMAAAIFHRGTNFLQCATIFQCETSPFFHGYLYVSPSSRTKGLWYPSHWPIL